MSSSLHLLDNILKEKTAAQGACAHVKRYIFLFVTCSAPEEKIARGFDYTKFKTPLLCYHTEQGTLAVARQ